MKELHKNVALAIDGGGIKGVIVARALQALEQELGSRLLIDQPQIKILAGTSTGAIITAGIALGLSLEEISEIYEEFGRAVFPSVPRFLWYLIGLFRPSVHPNEKLKELLRKKIGEKTGKPDLTLGQLQGLLREDQVLIITVVNINERRTHFLKSNDPRDADWMLWEAVLASSSAPIELPVFERNGEYYTDGGVGSYGNPAYIAAHEAVEWQGYDPDDVSVLSFGTGWTREETFEQTHGKPSNWRNIDWAKNAPLLITGDAVRVQSVEVIDDFKGLDFRRFQIILEPDISMTDASNEAIQRMQQIGNVIGQRILKNQFAPNTNPQFDPEGIQESIDRYQKSVKGGTRILAYYF